MKIKDLYLNREKNKFFIFEINHFFFILEIPVAIHKKLILIVYFYLNKQTGKIPTLHKRRVI